MLTSCSYEPKVFKEDQREIEEAVISHGQKHYKGATFFISIPRGLIFFSVFTNDIADCTIIICPLGPQQWLTQSTSSILRGLKKT